MIRTVKRGSGSPCFSRAESPAVQSSSPGEKSAAEKSHRGHYQVEKSLSQNGSPGSKRSLDRLEKIETGSRYTHRNREHESEK